MHKPIRNQIYLGSDLHENFQRQQYQQQRKIIDDIQKKVQNIFDCTMLGNA